eukprot:TRINITY_DN18602_c0_g1_i1.p1 TRINITY_DN18602_c0_g1~~TRINITY_DN18602_c0_g1_i1.p1  ORF type:complete len:786 (+),score=369.64 TRINITY_DN18602_c0_g1_i1:110-2467(+)
MSRQTNAAANYEYMYHPGIEKLPLMPGNNFHDDPLCRNTLKKSHNLGKQHVEKDFVPPVEYSETNHPTGWEATTKSVVSRRKDDSIHVAPADNDEKQAKWAHADDPYVFLAYCKEAVFESAIETFRIRKVAITYFGNDKTLSIREERVQNSGALNSVHGGGAVLLRRHQVLDTDGSPLDLDDIQIGEEFECYGRVYQVINCTDKTREKLKEKGWVVPDGLPFPTDDDSHRKHNDKRMRMTGRRLLSTDDMDVKRQAEFAISGRYSKVHPEATRAAKQFLAAGGSRTLSFLALWDNSASTPEDVRVLCVKYYLEDDTLEISEKQEMNSGREGSGRFLCRQRVSRDGSTDGAIQHNTFGSILRENYLTHGDLKIGATYRIHGKPIFIFDADAYTRAWYVNNHPEAPLGDAVEVTVKQEKAPVKHYPPPHDGIGHEDDSLGNWKNLMLRPLKKDVKRQLDEGHVVYRFKARMVGSKYPEDGTRPFVVNFYTTTNEVEIIETSVRNSGIIAGTFLAKRQVANVDPKTGEKVFIQAKDMFVGNVLRILSYEFELEEIDQRSQKYIDHTEEPLEEAAVKKHIVMLKELLNQKHERIAPALKSISSSGKVTSYDIDKFFALHSVKLTRKESKSILMHFDRTGKGYADLQDFIRMMEFDSSHNLDACSNRAAAIKLNRTAAQAAAGGADEYDVEDRAAAENELYRRTLGMLRDKLLQRRMRQQEVFRLLAGGRQSDASSKLQRKDFEVGLQDKLHMAISEREKGILVRALFGQKDEVTYLEFTTFTDGLSKVA